MKLTEAQQDALHVIEVCGFAALLTDDERAELPSLFAASLVQRYYSGFSVAMVFAKLSTKR